MDEDTIANAEAWSARNGSRLLERLGTGIHGIVFAVESNAEIGPAALKVHYSRKPYLRERRVYERLQDLEVSDILGFVIDCNCASPGDSPYVYTITLRREDSLFFGGEWTAGKSVDRDTGTCSCRLYSNGERLAFMGVWKQDGSTEHWCGELTPVDKFEDE